MPNHLEHLHVQPMGETLGSMPTQQLRSFRVRMWQKRNPWLLLMAQLQRRTCEKLAKAHQHERYRDTCALWVGERVLRESNGDCLSGPVGNAFGGGDLSCRRHPSDTHGLIELLRSLMHRNWQTLADRAHHSGFISTKGRVVQQNCNVNQLLKRSRVKSRNLEID